MLLRYSVNIIAMYAQSRNVIDIYLFTMLSMTQKHNIIAMYAQSIEECHQYLLIYYVKHDKKTMT